MTSSSVVGRCRCWTASELERRGYLLHGAKTEPWTKITAPLRSPEGRLVAVCYTPWFHESDGQT